MFRGRVVVHPEPPQEGGGGQPAGGGGGGGGQPGGLSFSVKVGVAIAAVIVVSVI
ncbi:hypothetical protein L195_g046804, partial [Trifolium pratense]